MQDLCFEALATSKPPPYFSTSMAMIDEYLTHGFVSVGAPLQYGSVLPTWTSQIGSGQFWKKKKKPKKQIAIETPVPHLTVEATVPGWGDALLLAQGNTNEPQSFS